MPSSAKKTPFELDTPAIYRIRVQGHLDDNCSEWLSGMTITRDFDEHDRPVTGVMDGGYEAPNYDQKQLEKLRKKYKQEFLDSGITLTYAAKSGEVDQHILDLSHAAGWGGMPKILGITNVYLSFETMSGDVGRSITFEDPGNKFFTSFTLYDADGYLIEGETHINDKMWKPNEDGTITLNFNGGDDAINNLSSGGQPFNCIVRSYGVSQKVMDDTWKPVKPEPVKEKISTKHSPSKGAPI